MHVKLNKFHLLFIDIKKEKSFEITPHHIERHEVTAHDGLQTNKELYF